MDGLAIDYGPPRSPASRDRPLDEIHRDRPVVGAENERFALSQEQYRVECIAQLRGRLGQGLKHRLQIEGRAADHLEHVGGSCLLRQGFAQLVEQAGVLDGDNGLFCKVAKKLNLLVGKGANLLTVDRDRAGQLVFLEHWDHNERTDAGNFCAGDGHRVALNSVRMFGGEIGDMHDLFCFGDPHDRSVLAWLMTAAPHELDISLWHTEQCNQASGGSLKPEHHSKIGFADESGLLQHGIEHGLQLPRRTGNDAQHLRRRCLLLQRLGEVARARLHLVKQTHVLDRDYGLIGKGGHEFDLLFREWLHPAPRQHNDADRTSLAQQRNADHGTSTNFSYDIAQCVVWIVQNIGDLDYFAFDNGSPQNRPAPRHEPTLPHMFIELLRKSVACNIGVCISYWAMDRSSVGLAQPGSRLHQRIKHRLQIEGRAADY